MLRPIDEVLALGYLIVGGAIETTCYVVLVIGWLLLVPLGEAMAAGAGTASPAGVRVGNLVIDADAANAVTALVFCLGGAMFYVLLYRSRIAPRWISAWGLVAIPFYTASFLLPLYGVFDVNAPARVLMYVPLAVPEMVLAVWMIARGFRPCGCLAHIRAIRRFTPSSGRRSSAVVGVEPATSARLMLPSVLP